MTQACYMCDEPETSREHVPAACFFPERKDLPPGVDLRRNLFTVPSCDAHNSHKSQDDQYLWQIVISAQGLNECGQRMQRTKGLRSISRRPAVAASLMRTAVPSFVLDPQTGQWHETIKVEFDAKRVFGVLRQFGRALYFLHFGTKWLGDLQPFPNFAQFSQSSGFDKHYLRLWRSIIDRVSDATAQLERIGSNQDAFYYQVMPTDGTPGAIMRATFYGGATVTIGYIVLPATTSAVG